MKSCPSAFAFAMYSAVVDLPDEWVVRGPTAPRKKRNSLPSRASSAARLFSSGIAAASSCAACAPAQLRTLQQKRAVPTGCAPSFPFSRMPSEISRTASDVLMRPSS